MASLKTLGGEISTMFVVLSLPVALVLSNYHADEESRILIFKEEVPNKALHGHVIATGQVLNEGSCRLQCYLEPDCVSINVGPLKDGSHQCDLNDVTDDKEFAVVLTHTTGFTYNGVENPCRRGPCKNNGTCQAGFTSEGFRCICPIGTLGKKCERGKTLAKSAGVMYMKQNNTSIN